jgi:soluble lytic murein transglycosylase
MAACVLILSTVAGFALWWWSEWRVEHSQDRPILEAATRYSLDPALVKAVVWKESRFQPRARGRAGEIGLMQLMDPAAQEWAETARVYPLPERHLFDPCTNTLAGAWYLRKLLQRYRGTDDPVPYALADYNAGRGNVLKWARAAAATNSHEFVAQIGFPSTRDYVESVMRRWKHYQRERGGGIVLR